MVASKELWGAEAPGREEQGQLRHGTPNQALRRGGIMKTIAFLSFTLLVVAEAAHAEEWPALDNCLSQPGDEKKDDKGEKFPAPPAGFDTRRDEITGGKLETIEYDSTTVGVKRKARIYTPPGYTTDQKYPVLYLLHGIGGDENEWGRGGVPDVILDNLYADKKAVPMIVVMPNGRASKDVTARDPIPKQSPALPCSRRTCSPI